MIERDQAGGGIGTAAPQTTANRDSFRQADVGAQLAGSGCFKRMGCAYAKVGVQGNTGNLDRAPNLPVRARLDRNLVAQVDKLKTGLQFVVAVRPPSQYM